MLSSVLISTLRNLCVLCVSAVIVFHILLPQSCRGRRGYAEKISSYDTTHCLFDSAGKLTLDTFAAFPNPFCSQRGSLEDEIDSLNLRGLLGGICFWL